MIVGFCLPKGTKDLITDDKINDIFTLESNLAHNFTDRFWKLKKFEGFNLFYDREHDIIYRKYYEVGSVENDASNRSDENCCFCVRFARRNPLI